MRRNRMILCLLILGTGILVGNYGGSVSYLLFYSTLVLPILSLIYLGIVYSRFRIYQEIETKVIVKEERVPYLFKLSNEDILSYTRIRVNFMKDYSDVENMSQSEDYCLMPQEQIEYQTTLCCHYRGGYRVGIDEVTVTDYLNLFQFTYKWKAGIQVQVLPRVIHLNKLALIPKSEDIKNQKFFIEARNEIPDTEVRKYIPSDSPRMIHWKASAKYGELLTRKYTEEPKTELILVVDFRKMSEDEKLRIILEDKIIEALIAIADYFMRSHTPISVLFHDNARIQKLRIYNSEEFQQLYQICSYVNFNSDVSSENLLSYAMENSTGRQYGLLLTSFMTDEFCKVAYQYVNMGHELSVVMVGEDRRNEANEKLDQRIHYYQIGYQQEVRDVLEMEEV